MSDTKMQINGFYRFSIVMVKYVASGTHVISLMTTFMVYVKQPIQRTGWAKKRGHRLMTVILSNLNRLKNYSKIPW